MAKPMINDPDELATPWSLIRKLTQAECDDQSWEQFYRLYENIMYRVACKAGLTHEEAQDAVVETMHSVYRSIRDFRPDPAHGSFKSWLFKLTSPKTSALRAADRCRPGI